MDGTTSLGINASGAYSQSGGTAVLNHLNIGAGQGVDSSVEVSGGSFEATDVHIGAAKYSSGTFQQSGGNVSITQVLFIGDAPNTSGTYTLDSGTLTSPQVFVGTFGSGQYIQNGGSANVLGFDIGPESTGGSGKCTLTDGDLTALLEKIGPNSSITQTGGRNTVTFSLNIYPGGKYKLAGGTLRVKGLNHSGEIDFANGAATFIADTKSFIDFRSTTLRNTSHATLSGEAGSLIEFAGGFNPLTAFAHVNTLGLIHVAGQNLTVPSDKSLNGTGTITGNVTNQGLVSPGNSPGQLVVEGNFVQASTGSMLMELAGAAASQFDSVSVTGSLTVDGQLQLSLLDGFIPSASDQFPILTATSLTGHFTNAPLTIAFPQGTFDVLYSSSAVTLTNFSAVPEPGAIPGLIVLPILFRRRARAGR